jgi:hypothetical protein
MNAARRYDESYANLGKPSTPDTWCSGGSDTERDRAGSEADSDARQQQGSRETHQDSEEREPESVCQHKLHYVGSGRAESHADPNLVGSTRDGISEHSIDPHARQNQGQPSKDSQQDHQELPWRHRLTCNLIESPDIGNRLVLVQGQNFTTN